LREGGKETEKKKGGNEAALRFSTSAGKKVTGRPHELRGGGGYSELTEVSRERGAEDGASKQIDQQQKRNIGR